MVGVATTSTRNSQAWGSGPKGEGGTLGGVNEKFSRMWSAKSSFNAKKLV